jgi:hypothetical protein
MVWIHGGAFMAGGTGIELFDCTNLIKENPGMISCAKLILARVPYLKFCCKVTHKFGFFLFFS